MVAAAINSLEANAQLKLGKSGGGNATINSACHWSAMLDARLACSLRDTGELQYDMSSGVGNPSYIIHQPGHPQSQ